MLPCSLPACALLRIKLAVSRTRRTPHTRAEPSAVSTSSHHRGSLLFSHACHSWTPPQPHTALSPSSLILAASPLVLAQVLLALCGTLLVIGVVVLILELKERMHDSRMKKRLAPALPL